MPAPVRVKPFDQSHPDQTSVKVFYGTDIMVDGQVLGRVQNFQDQEGGQMGTTHIRELSRNGSRVPVDIVPGIVEGFNLSLGTVSLWNNEIELRLGWRDTGRWNNLSDQDRPFTMRRLLYRGSELYQTTLYRGCWITSKTPSGFEAEGDGIVRMDCEIAYVARYLV